MGAMVGTMGGAGCACRQVGGIVSGVDNKGGVTVSRVVGW